MKFPEHLSLVIRHNEHKDNYESVEEYFKRRPHEDEKSDHWYVKPEMLKKMIEADSIWDVSLSPCTPISHYDFWGATWEDIEEQFKEIMDEERQG